MTREERWRRVVTVAAPREVAQVDRGELLRVEGEAEVDRATVAAVAAVAAVAPVAAGRRQGQMVSLTAALL